MTAYRGMTWDHPRGRIALEAAAQRDAELELSWDAQPLEGFESHPIDELARGYDLLVLDHPHLGDAVAAQALTPLDELFDATELETWAAATVGPSFESYRLEGRVWALPLDAATQVAALRPDLITAPPATWAEVLELSRGGRVAPSLAGPHALLTLCSILVSLGAPPREPSDGEAWLDPDRVLEALEILVRLARAAPDGAAELNPIGLLERMTLVGDIAYCPLVYGYVTYADPAADHPLAFADAPVASARGRLGSTLGGTGIALSRRAEPSPELLDHLRWLMSSSTQRRFIPEHAGQPSARSAWTDPALDERSGGFYSRTLATIEHAWVRPRFPGYIPLQSDASSIVRDIVTGRMAAAEGVAEIERRAENARAAAERERSRT